MALLQCEELGVEMWTREEKESHDIDTSLLWSVLFDILMFFSQGCSERFH